jgi:hypothetical protein
VMALSERLGRGMMSIPSHASDGAIGATWPQHDINTESCWLQRCRTMLAMTLPRQLGRNAMSMSSHASDGATESYWHWCRNSRLY